MRSQWEFLKKDALSLRQHGQSIGFIEKKLGIPRSTLSGWFKDVRLSNAQLETLKQRQEKGLILARKKAVIWHNAQKALRIERAKDDAQETLCKLSDDSATLELALAFLYLGEGSKNFKTSLGSSNPDILKFFIRSLQILYEVPSPDIKCYLHLRADQEPDKLIRFWSRELGLPSKNFGKVSLDKRTASSPTYPHYKGVCQVTCSRVEIQRRLLYIASGFTESVIKNS